MSASPRIGVLIVAYNAESTVDAVLGRISPATLDRLTEVFVFDDSSSDHTAKTALDFQGVGYEKVTVFRNQVNLGYGGNQKRGYRYAIERGLDVVVLLHADGQYAPEYLDRLIDPITDGTADAVFGSRMLIKGAALEGGMPLYKFVGNKILTGMQNALTGARLSEFHSGYRAYSTHALATLPLDRNTDDFHFDTQIIYQLLANGSRIREIPIPTYYGDEICRVEGLVYAFNVTKETLKYRIHTHTGLAYAAEYDLDSEERYVLKLDPFSSHSRILELIDPPIADQPAEVLDVGCGSGYLAAEMAERGYRVSGIDVYDNARAREVCDRFLVVNVEEDFGVDTEERFDYVVLADVLEHVRNPETVMLRAREHLKPNGVILASTGNVAHFLVRLMLLFGRFEYTDRGILDRTHVRLFTRRSFLDLFSACGFRVARVRYCPIPFERVIPRLPRLAKGLAWFNMLFAATLPGLFAYQFVVRLTDDLATSGALQREQERRSVYVPFQDPKASSPAAGRAARTGNP